MCTECAEKVKIYERETRAFLKNLGLCPRCGKNQLFGDEKECLECRAMMYELNKKSRERRNITAMDYYRREIKILKEHGLCRSCRKRKVAEGHTYCSICLARKLERGKELRKRKEKVGLDRSERPSYGFCYTCGEPLDREGRICKKCAEIMTANLPWNSDNKNWRADNKLIFRNGGSL